MYVLQTLCVGTKPAGSKPSKEGGGKKEAPEGGGSKPNKASGGGGGKKAEDEEARIDMLDIRVGKITKVGDVLERIVIWRRKILTS